MSLNSYSALQNDAFKLIMCKQKLHFIAFVHGGEVPDALEDDAERLDGDVDEEAPKVVGKRSRILQNEDVNEPHDDDGVVEEEKVRRRGAFHDGLDQADPLRQRPPSVPNDVRHLGKKLQNLFFRNATAVNYV